MTSHSGDDDDVDSRCCGWWEALINSFHGYLLYCANKSAFTLSSPRGATLHISTHCDNSQLEEWPSGWVKELSII